MLLNHASRPVLTQYSSNPPAPPRPPPRGRATGSGAGATITSNAFVTQSVPAHTRVSVKSPELQFKGGVVREFKQELVADWQI